MLAEDVIAAFPGPFGAYVHVPFCTRICPFCPYNKVRDDDARAARYFAALTREAEAYGAAMRRPFTSLYVGGGTPTLHLELLERALRALRVDGERAIEVLPTHATPERLDVLRGMGFTHVSLGIQSFDDDALRRLARPTTAQDNLRALEAAAGRFACVDVDLIFDVATTHEQVFLDDVERAFSFGVEQVSAYPLMRFGFTPFGKAAHTARLEHAALARAEALAAAHGYERRSVWTFGRRGAPSYSSITRPLFLGLGAGSASFTGRSFLVNEFALEPYLARVEAGAAPIARAFALPPAVAALYAAFWRTYAGRLDVGAVRDAFGATPARLVRALASGAVAAGWAHGDGGLVTLTPRGLDRFHDLERFVTYAFIEPLWAEMLADHGEDPAASWRRAAAPSSALFRAARALFESGTSPPRARW